MAEEQHKPNDDLADDEGFQQAFAERMRGDAAPPAGEPPANSEPALAGSEAAPSHEAARVSPAEPTPTAFDPWAGMTPEQKAHFERLQASERSQRGRVGALTKKLNHMPAQAPIAAPVEQRQEQQPPSGENQPPVADDLETRLTKVAEEYGDVNGPVIEAIRAIQADVAKMQPRMEQVDLQNDSIAIGNALVELEGKHPDYQTIADDPVYAAWRDVQPVKVQELLYSYDPDEVSLGLALYKAERGLSRPAEQGQQGNPGSSATDDRRARQLEGSRSVTSRGAPAAAGVPDDFDAAFMARAKSFTSP